MTKPRIRRLSTRYLTTFRMTIYVTYSAILFTLLYYAFTRVGAFTVFGNLLIYGYWLYSLIRILDKLKKVEFDDDYLYVIGKTSDILIPLENIESVEIVTIGGVYKVNLYFEDSIGKYFYFKPSIFYPMNYQTKDRLVNLLRERINHAKQLRFKI
jgi:hypothetical protein